MTLYIYIYIFEQYKVGESNFYKFLTKFIESNHLK